MGYAVFAKVTAGMEVVRKIEHKKTTTKAGRGDVPVETIMIKSVEIQMPATDAAAPETATSNTETGKPKQAL